MNIKQAKEYIKNTVKLYLKKDEFGEYRVPVVRQRPIFLLGAPGIGKTAVMEQIAQEMGIALVSYSMTHHTRQSALGLPFITQKNYDGAPYSVSEYTMSEIIATVYDTMEEGGIKEGILFLDEINCVSETLAPAMLQFLQYKTFGRHQVPQGWVVVTAGNPPEYNKSVREFDVVTYDRLKVMEVEPDYSVWKEYAGEKRLHNAVVSYLDLKKEHFYRIEMRAGKRSYVTARGWEDLSEILALHEEEELPVDETLVGQYLRNEEVVKEFAAYYDLYQKYKREYHIADILKGAPSDRAVARARKAAFDERLSLMGMLLDRVQADMQAVMEQVSILTDLKNPLKAIGNLVEQKGCSAKKEETAANQKECATEKEETAGEQNECTAEQIISRLEALEEARRKQMESLRRANSLSETDRKKSASVLRFLEESRRELNKGDAPNGKAAVEQLKKKYNGKISEMKLKTANAQGELHALFAFAEEAFGEGNEMLILVTELTRNSASARFLGMFGSPDYARYSEGLMLAERRADILAQIEQIERISL